MDKISFSEVEITVEEAIGKTLPQDYKNKDFKIKGLVGQSLDIVYIIKHNKPIAFGTGMIRTLPTLEKTVLSTSIMYRYSGLYIDQVQAETVDLNKLDILVKKLDDDNKKGVKIVYAQAGLGLAIGVFSAKTNL